MSLKVLLADDNITAQRMGSKILTDAGYEVIAVSNGAAAIKRIASEKPELLILDVYMPGYTGLEVCEKIKNDPVTAQMPVILTVTNMEPFNQADGSRVRADGVMIKPFEATDLIAVVQKFEVKSGKTAPGYPKTQKLTPVEEFKDASYEEWKAEAPDEPEPAKMEMSAEVAAAPAMAFDEPVDVPAAATMAATDFTVETAAPSFGVEAPSPFEAEATPAFGLEAAAPAFGIEEIHPPALELPSLDLSPSPEPLPSFDAALSAAPPAEFEATSAPQVGEIATSLAPELEVQTSSGEAVMAQDPALVTNADEMSQFATSVGVEHPEEVVVGIAMPGLTAEEAPVEVVPQEVAADFAPPTPDLSNLDTVKIPAFVDAATMAAPEASPTAEEPGRSRAVEVEMQSAFSAGSFGAAAAPALEPVPEAPAVEPEPAPDHLVAQFQAELDQAHEEREAMGLNTPIAEEVVLTEASMPSAPETSASQLDEERIAAAVNRALEKYKEGLRAELIATIVRELKGE